MDTSNPSPQLRTVLAWMGGYTSLNTDIIFDQLSDSYQHHFLPKSVGRPILNKEQFKAHTGKLAGAFDSFKLDVVDFVEMPGKIVLQANSEGKLSSGELYENQYVFIFHFETPSEDNQNPKISVLKEFMDSLYTTQFFTERAKKAAEAQEAK